MSTVSASQPGDDVITPGWASAAALHGRAPLGDDPDAFLEPQRPRSHPGAVLADRMPGDLVGSIPSRSTASSSTG